MCCLRLVKGPNFIELQQSGLHDASSHENDKSEYLKYDQIIAVHDSAVTAPQLSGAVIRRNLQMADSPSKIIDVKHQRCIQRCVYNVRRELNRNQLKGCKVDDLLGEFEV